jgi:tetratricopeptide (TPR) repeat protein
MGLIIDHPTLATFSATVSSPRLTRTLWLMLRQLTPLWWGLCALLLAGTAHAQLIDDVDIRREGADAVLQIRFITGVQYLRSVSTRSGDQTLVFYRVLPTRQALELVTSERRLAARAGTGGTAGLPAIIVTDEAATGRIANERRVIVRFASPVKHRVRAVRGDRGIDIVLEGAASVVVRPPAAADLPATAVGRFRVTVEASEEAGAFLSAAIPAALQNANVFTTRRVVNGRVLYETHLGPYATRAEADAARAVLRGRFPAAAVTLADAPADAVAAAPASAPPPQVPAPVVAAAVAPAASTPAAPAAAPPAPAPATAEQARPQAAPPVAAALPPDADLDRRAAALLAAARAALERNDAPAAIDTLGQLLDLPPTASTREAQALIGQARLKVGDSGRARAEFELFLRLYPAGPDADGVRSALAAMSPQAPGGPAAAAAGERRVAATTTLTGSVSSFFYGGQSKVRTQEFQESLIGGLPELLSDATLSDTDQQQLVSSVDVNWRHRDADVDQRFVFRDTYAKDFLRPDKTKNKLSALYYDQRSFSNGTSFRVGRQTPLGGGVLGRFDGVQAGYAFRPRWKASVVAGVPTDALLDSRRHFYGASLEAEAITPQLGGSLYAIEQKIDGTVDRRAIGSDIRWFDGGLSATAQLDYDLVLKGLNIASVQGTWQRADNTVINVMYDRRNTPMLMLGNSLFFAGANLTTRPTRITDLLATSTVQALREQVKATTAVSTQGALGLTTPISPRWQVGADVRYTNTGAIAPVPDLLPQGQPSTGDIWSLSTQLIGTNLYSARDTHVIIANFINGPTFQGQLLSYNNSSLLAPEWQLEPSFKLYRQTTNGNVRSVRWSPGLRLTWRVRQEMALESEVSVENSKTTSPTRNESSTRTFYYLGGRYDF